MSLSRTGVVVAALSLPISVAGQKAPRVVSLSPTNESVEVDPATSTLTVEFDQAMGAGRSVVGGGPNFPKIKDARWKNPKTFVIDVELRPDHDYTMLLNSHTFRNFRSRKGVALDPVRWSFTTLPRDLPNPRKQKQRNKAAFAELEKLLPQKYSYYDRKVKNWKKAFKTAKPAMLGAKTDVGWARAAARMLEPTEDIHLHLRIGDRTFATGRRAVDPLYRGNLLGEYVSTKKAGSDNALWGRTADDIGYLMIASWTNALDMAAIEQALDKMRDCKAMIIDARPNSGGNELLARRVAAWFVEGKKVYAKNRYRVRGGKNGFGKVLDRVIEGSENADKQYRGPIAVLTSRYVMSSNESFVMMLQQAPDCTVVGQPTFGSSGNPKAHDLSNGVTIVMPSWQDLRLDETCLEGEGIAPDVLVEATAEDLEKRDPILERALELLRAKIGK